MKRLTFVVLASAFALVSPAIGKPPTAGSSGVTITASRNPVVFGSSTTLSGQVAGKKSAGATVELQSQPWPYTAAFSKVATTTADATGHYSLKVSPALNTAYKVVAKTAPTATSGTLLVKVRVAVSLGVSTTKPAKGQQVRFSGFVLPAYNGKRVQIQRRTRTGWKTVARPKLSAATALRGVARSKYSARLRINATGTYRVSFNPADGARLANTSAGRKLTVH
jgi:hypothetical protein